ncbi:MAG: chemotaxis protein CheR, partial [Deltaproteobacteria bacterium]
MDTVLFQRFRDLAYQQAGIDLRDGKEALMDARIARRVRALGLDNAHQYLDRLRGDRTGVEMVNFLDAISTNFTSFFREKDHFDVLRAQAERAHKQG